MSDKASDRAREAAKGMYITMLVFTVLTVFGYVVSTYFALVCLLCVPIFGGLAVKALYEDDDMEEADQAGAIVVAVIGALLVLVTGYSLHLQTGIVLTAESKLRAAVADYNTKLGAGEERVKIPTYTNAVIGTGITAEVVDWSRVDKRFAKFNPENHVRTRFENGVLATLLALHLGSVVGSAVMISRTN